LRATGGCSNGRASLCIRVVTDAPDYPAIWLRQRRFIHIDGGEVVRLAKRAMKARVTVTLKSGILDPQGKAIEGALKSLGVGGVASVRQGKIFDIEIEGADRAGAETALKNAAEKLLANTVIENYRIEVTG
jgi:phosphoribosylformylglycinamidine synthase subunit PurS